VSTTRLSLEEVKQRADDLRQLHAPYIDDRHRIRAVMDGGIEGVRQLLGDNVDIGDEQDIPAAHLMFSGIERLAQKLGQIPDIRVPVPDHIDSTRSKKAKAKVARIVEGYDDVGSLELQMLQLARWVPGYGFGVWVVREKEINRQRYPVTKMHNPHNAYPGHWGVDQRPTELAMVRRVPGRTLHRVYGSRFTGEDNGNQLSAFNVGELGKVWESPGSPSGFNVIDYFDVSGTYTFVEETDDLLSYTENKLGMPRFVIPHRPSFNALVGQFSHLLGLMSMYAKLNVLAAVAMEDAVEVETNIFGQLRGNEYLKGRHVTNELEVNARVEKPTTNMPYQLFEQIDRLERQLRLTSGYPITDDAESPNSFVTGRGLEELGAGSSRIVNEYQTILKHALQDLDEIRLTWDEEFYGSQTKNIYGMHQGTPYTEKYTPKEDIRGQHRTKRVYGMMAGFDDPTMIVTALQLLDGGVIDVETVQENLRGLDNAPRINERIRKRGVEQNLLAGLGQQFAQGDPRAALTLSEMYQNPGDFEDILAKFFTPQEPQMSPEEEQLVGAAAGVPGQQGPIPDVRTSLTRLTQEGQAEGGVQTVRTNRIEPRRA